MHVRACVHVCLCVFIFYFVIIMESQEVAKQCTGRSHVLLVQFLPIVNILTGCTSIMTKKQTFIQSPKLRQISPVLYALILYMFVFITCVDSRDHHHAPLLGSKSFQFWWSPIYEFFLLWSILIMSSLQLHLTPGPANFLLCFLLKFYSFTFQSVIDFELIFT